MNKEEVEKICDDLRMELCKINNCSEEELSSKLKQVFAPKILSEEKIKELSEGYTENKIVRNPDSGQEIELDPIAVAIYDYIKGCEMFNLWERMHPALNWFRLNRPTEYMILLD